MLGCICLLVCRSSRAGRTVDQTDARTARRPTDSRQTRSAIIMLVALGCGRWVTYVCKYKCVSPPTDRRHFSRTRLSLHLAPPACHQTHEHAASGWIRLLGLAIAHVAAPTSQSLSQSFCLVSLDTLLQMEVTFRWMAGKPHPIGFIYTSRRFFFPLFWRPKRLATTALLLQ